MFTFKLTDNPEFVLRSDGWLCRIDLENYRTFVALGGVPIPADIPHPNVAILAQIAAFEASISPRRQREALLTVAGKDWLAGVDAQIAALRVTLA